MGVCVEGPGGSGGSGRRTESTEGTRPVYERRFRIQPRMGNVGKGRRSRFKATCSRWQPSPRMFGRGDRRRGRQRRRLTAGAASCRRADLSAAAGCSTSFYGLSEFTGSGGAGAASRTAVEQRRSTGASLLDRGLLVVQKGPGPVWPWSVVLLASTHCPNRSPPTQFGLGSRGNMLPDEVSELSHTAMFPLHTRSPAM